MSVNLSRIRNASMASAPAEKYFDENVRFCSAKHSLGMFLFGFLRFLKIELAVSTALARRCQTTDFVLFLRI